MNRDEWEKRRVAKATKVLIGECTGPVMFNDDQFYSSIEDLLEYLNNEADPESDDYPLVAWSCDEVTPQIDTERWKEDFADTLELAEDVEVENVTTDFQEILDAMKAWNAKQKPTLYVPSDNRCILINKSDIFADEG
jgi:hypothetical protein